MGTRPHPVCIMGSLPEVATIDAFRKRELHDLAFAATRPAFRATRIDHSRP